MIDTIETKAILKAGPAKRDGTTSVKQVVPQMISGIRMRLRHFVLKTTLLRVAVQCYGDPVDWWRALRHLVQLRRRFLGDHRLQKMAIVADKYYMGLYTPGWNSQVYRTFIASQLNDFKPVRIKVNRFNTVFMAITKKCALQCEHCYEWDQLNRKDILSTESLNLMVAQLQGQGVSQIQFSGGEPLLKVDRLVQVLENARPGTEFWVATSGYPLNMDNARLLKKAGLTGVIISLDHHVPEKHNTFRGFKEAYQWVETAVCNAVENNLVTALSLCATRDFISMENLMAYMELAKKLRVSFVQLLEPKAVGHYASQEVHLLPEQIAILEDFYLKLNFEKAYAEYPIVTYHGYYQRRQGCFSAGVKGLYVDTDGEMNACPFCHTQNGNLLADGFEERLENMRASGCPSFLNKPVSHVF